MQIKNVPEDVHRILRRRAVEAGHRCRSTCLGRLTEDAGRPTLDEALRRAGDRAGGSVPLDDAVSAVRAERDAR